jgi:8-oxo-dGTP pyrophosphatase MutT (NUDIX family)
LHPNPEDTGFRRHVLDCNNVVLPGGRRRFLIGEQPVGWVPPPIAAALGSMPDIDGSSDNVVLQAPAALPGIARSLAQQGLFRLRGEAFDVRTNPDGAVLAQIDRGAIPAFGIQAVGVHVNGLVHRPDGLHVWIGRRARDKRLDPGKLDHIVAGGVAAGAGPMETLTKEAGEEAAVPPELAAQARLVSSFGYVMERREGLRRDWLYCYDLILPEDFLPRPADGEVESFELWPIEKVIATVKNTNDFKFNVNLVLIDLFIRLGLIEPAQ